MPLSALALVLVAALLHASWNYWVKLAQAPGPEFTFLCAVAVTVLYAPLTLWWCGDELRTLGGAQWVAITASALLHVAYFLVLQRGYALADLSVVYPVARGTGPLLASVGAILWFGESPSLLAAVGLLSIVTGTFTLAGGPALWGRLREAGDPAAAAQARRARTGVWWGLATGVLIASYTLNDARAVTLLGITPLLLDWLASALRGLAIAPLALHRAQSLRLTLRRCWPHILGVAVVSPLAYILVLEAFRLAPVSHVAPARELSMLVAAFLGAHLLREGDLRRRITGAAFIAAGVVCLGLARH